MDTWLTGLMTEIINEHPWSIVEIHSENKPEEDSVDRNWSTFVIHNPCETNIETIEKLVTNKAYDYVTLVFRSETDEDKMTFRKSEGTTPQEQLYVWSMMGPLDRAFIRHWKKGFYA